ncbi:hypothetical protein EDEG_00012 [Edhazardia aedis USNM 41457]|uniref:Septin-type G domain-containing protein n=1 Tax=Edhazardia aedis (strain USNM 41457) TaxID=1003232 RepID=J9DP80_EDHAE|nr:hypothetical protein EDEG_00012 [Edhazardia aedis USNM 41457]|eukprot:EJW03142.1 hypothetical protein EDEG_00012 [Edhazardia aedis USNM 41457]
MQYNRTRRRRQMLSLMVAGRCGLGKSTFLNTLLNKKIASSSTDINVYVMDIDCEGQQKRITVIDTPGFGKSLDDTLMHNNLSNFIKLQFDKYLSEETKVRRNPLFEDTRVHVLLYFVGPSIAGLKATDIAFLKHVESIVNVVLVVGKSDGLNCEEKTAIKRVINQQVNKNEIKLFDFANLGINEQRLCESSPFLIIGSEDRQRKFRWGNVMVDDQKSCDFQILKELLFGNIDVFVDVTDCELYENYRTTVLSEMLPLEKS